MILYLAAMGANAAHDGVTDAESLLAQSVHYARDTFAEQQGWAKAAFAPFQSLSSDPSTSRLWLRLMGRPQVGQAERKPRNLKSLLLQIPTAMTGLMLVFFFN